MKILRGDHHGGESGPKGSGCPFQGEGGVFEFALNPPPSSMLQKPSAPFLTLSNTAGALPHKADKQVNKVDGPGAGPGAARVHLREAR